jgi:hypothetical protein
VNDSQPMYRDEAGMVKSAVIAGSDGLERQKATTTIGVANGNVSAGPYGANLLDIFRRAHPEA